MSKQKTRTTTTTEAERMAMLRVMAHRQACKESTNAGNRALEERISKMANIIN